MCYFIVCVWCFAFVYVYTSSACLLPTEVRRGPWVPGNQGYRRREPPWRWRESNLSPLKDGCDRFLVTAGQQDPLATGQGQSVPVTLNR